MARSKHPPCPLCGKALYKALQKGVVVKKSDSYSYCRNVDCALNGKDQGGVEKIEVLSRNVSRSKMRKKRRRRIQAVVDLEERKKDELKRNMLKNVVDAVNSKRGDKGFLCFVVLSIKELGFQSEYESIASELGLIEFLGG